MQFYSGIIAPLIIGPLRYYFSNYTRQTNIYWDEDEKLRTIDIGESFDFNKVSLQQKPRIIVTRGAYGISKVGITDNLAQSRPMNETGGRKDYINMVLYQGNATITVEAKTKGTCELILDMTSHFICWTRPILCDSQGWKEFGLPMAISDIGVTQDEDPGVSKFQANISIPWIKEEQWRYQTDGIELKKVFSDLKPI